jgi:hypothetical protein
MHINGKSPLISIHLKNGDLPGLNIFKTVRLNLKCRENSRVIVFKNVATAIERTARVEGHGALWLGARLRGAYLLLRTFSMEQGSRLSVTSLFKLFGGLSSSHRQGSDFGIRTRLFESEQYNICLRLRLAKTFSFPLTL